MVGWKRSISCRSPTYLTGSLRGVVANVLDYDTVKSEFKFQEHYYIHFRNNTFGKGLKPLCISSYALNNPTISFYKGDLGIK